MVPVAAGVAVAAVAAAAAFASFFLDIVSPITETLIGTSYFDALTQRQAIALKTKPFRPAAKS
jgi:hypothetical protein